MRFRILAVLAAFLLPLPLRADSITSFYLTVDENGHSTPPADSVLVTIDLSDPTHASVTFTGESGYLMNNVFLNVDGAFSVSSVSGVQPGLGTPSYHVSGAGGLDSYGTFSEFLTPTPSAGSSSIVIDLIATGSNTWSSASNVLIPTTTSSYPQGFDAAATVGLFSGEGSGSRDSLDIAGFIAPTPEPESFVLVGTGFLTVAGFIRRRVRRA
jgi:hypothetical protein